MNRTLWVCFTAALVAVGAGCTGGKEFTRPTADSVELDPVDDALVDNGSREPTLGRRRFIVEPSPAGGPDYLHWGKLRA